MPKNRMPRGLVALSAGAVAAVYAAGYLRTQAADSVIGAADLPTAASVTPVAVAVATPAPTATTAPSAPRVVVQRPTATPQTQTQLKDGTYNGQGTSRRGEVWVSVQVLSGRIANVTITRSTLQYPLRDIAGLPAEVVQRQTAQVDIVSRATYSSMAFRGAVTQALANAYA